MTHRQGDGARGGRRPPMPAHATPGRVPDIGRRRDGLRPSDRCRTRGRVLGPPPPPRLLLRESRSTPLPPLPDPFPPCSALTARCHSGQMEFWISVLLTSLGYLRGVLYTATTTTMSTSPDQWTDARGALVHASATSVRCTVCISVLG